MALLTVKQYAEYQGLPFPVVNFRVYDNREMYVPTPEMVKRVIYRIRKLELRAMVMIAVECGASASEVWNLKWKDVNFQSKSILTTGVRARIFFYSSAGPLIQPLIPISFLFSFSLVVVVLE